MSAGYSLLYASFLTAAPAAPRAPKHPSVFEETYVYLIALAMMIAALIAISLLRFRKQGKSYLNLLNALLKNTDVLLRAGETSNLRTCWHCGAPEAVRRPLRLSRVVFLGVGVGGEEITPMIPLCPEHDKPNLGPHWARLLSIPLGGLAFAITLATWPFHHRVLACVWIGAAAAVGVALGWFMRRWANRRETFRLLFLDTHDDIIIVRFNDVERAAAVRKEVGDPSEPLRPGSVASAGGSG